MPSCDASAAVGRMPLPHPARRRGLWGARVRRERFVWSPSGPRADPAVLDALAEGLHAARPERSALPTALAAARRTGVRDVPGAQRALARTRDTLAALQS